MGLIKAAMGAAGGTLADQWKEYFYCDSMDNDVLVVKGTKRTGKRSSNKHGSDNVITDGSVISVNEGQCMMIVENGRVAEVCAVPGEFIYKNDMEPSIFSGDLADSIRKTFEEIANRFAFGGEPAKDQRVYYFNIKEITGNKYGTPSPVPFRVIDRNVGLDMDISIRCHGEYSYRITNPLLFYTNVCANVEDEYTRDMIDSQLKSELMTALQPAFAKISDMGIRYSSLPGHTEELAQALRSVLSPKWSQLRGIDIVSVGVSSVKASEEDEAMIKELQRNAALRNPAMAAAHLTGAQADAMKSAAKNSAGAVTGFMGLNMAEAQGGANAAALYQMAAQQKVPDNTDDNTWTCSCGAVSSGKFCPECGSPKPELWTCTCGTVNSGKFCTNCGKPRTNTVQCSNCGWKPTDPSAPPAFCPECGKPFGK